MNIRDNFIPNGYYHVYNRTNASEHLFKNKENRRFFLSRFAFFLKPFCFIHSYALLKNHFHFSIQIRPEASIHNHLLQIEEEDITKLMQSYIDAKCNDFPETDRTKIFNLLICEQFKRFFTSYTRSYNKCYNRLGNLFRQKFRRTQYDPHEHFKYVQYYIHHNARKHGLVKQFESHYYQSYHEIITNQSELIDLPSVYCWFESRKNFITFHEATHYEDRFAEFDLDSFVEKAYV